MFERILEKIEMYRFKREYGQKIYHSKYLDCYLKIDRIHEWDYWEYEIYYFDDNFGWIPHFSNGRFGYSDTDVRVFVENAGGVEEFFQ